MTIYIFYVSRLENESITNQPTTNHIASLIYEIKLN